MNQWKKPYRNLLIVFLLVAVTTAVYCQVRDFEFVNLDDGGYVSENIAVQMGISVESLRWAFTSTAMANWHPLTWISHMVDCQLFDGNAGAHHLVNLLFHVLNAALLFLILQEATGSFWRSAFVAALFALHPLHVESVAWIAERKDVLSTLFWLLTTGAYLYYVRVPSRARYTAVVLLFALGLLAKPMLVTLPVILLMMDYWPLGRFHPAPVKPSAVPAQPAEPARAGRKGRKKQKQPAKASRPAEPGKGSPFMRLVGEKIPLLFLSFASSVITYIVQQKGGAVRSLLDVSLPDRIVNAVVSYAAYLWKTVYPADLAAFYPFPEAWSLPAILGSLVFLVGVTFYALKTTRRYPYLAFGWFWYLVTLLPVIGFIKVGDTAMADRYTYVTLIGPFITITWGATELIARRPHGKTILAFLATIVLVVSMALTYVQAGTWRSSKVLYEHALAVTKNNIMAHNNLGGQYMAEGRFEEALVQFRKVEEISRDNAFAHYNMAIILPYMGKPDEAKTRMRRALQLNPSLYGRYQDLGKFYLSVGQPDQAIPFFDRAIREDSYNYKAYAGMGEALDLQGRLAEALRYYRQVLIWRPQDEKIQNNVGFILIRQGRIDEAISCFREAVRINPNYARARNNLGSALMIQKNIDEAIYQFEEAVRIDPNYKTAQENLKDVLAQKKKGRR